MDTTISLLPFLESEKSRIFLDFPLSKKRAVSEHYACPFQVIDDSHIFFVLLNAGIKARDSRPLKSCFLMIQRDVPRVKDELNLFTNKEIDSIWQKTITSYSTQQNVFVFPEQLNPNGASKQFASLFFCAKKNVLFHPPCPQCGSRLHLCKDDGILKRASLSPYSTSLKRYLYCPNCYNDTGSSFYQFSHSIDDSASVKDRYDLINEFKTLENTHSKNFPCADCPNFAECYGERQAAVSNIRFFSFYPFHMLLFDSESMKAMDFIPLLSGAPLENALSTPFFFKDTEKFYLEVLFLKLSFFEAVIQSARQIFKNQWPDLNLYEQSIWVQLINPENSLPVFWNYTISIIGLISRPPTTPIEINILKNNNFHFITLFWFYLFFVNQAQEKKAVYDTVGRLAETLKNSDLSEDYGKLTTEFPVLKMENIFWHPDNRPELPPAWQAYGLEIIKLGLTINDLDSFTAGVSNLKQAVKNNLFFTEMECQSPEKKPAQEKYVPPLTSSPDLTEHDRQAIFQILNALKQKWETQQRRPQDEDDDVLETVVLTSPKKAPEGPPALEETIVLQPRKEKAEKPEEADETVDTLEKTIIMQGNDMAPIPSEPVSEPISDPIDDEFELEKTVVITQQPPKRS